MHSPCQQESEKNGAVTCHSSKKGVNDVVSFAHFVLGAPNASPQRRRAGRAAWVLVPTRAVIGIGTKGGEGLVHPAARLMARSGSKLLGVGDEREPWPRAAASL